MDPTITGALIGLCAAALGGAVTGGYQFWSSRYQLKEQERRAETERKLAFRLLQLSEFYGPTLALMQEIIEYRNLLTKAESDVELLIAESETPSTHDEKRQALIDYREHLLVKEGALLDEIKLLFRLKHGLLEASTAAVYMDMVRYIENRNLVKITVSRLNLNYADADLEERLKALYDNVEMNQKAIRQMLISGNLCEL